MIGHPAPLRRGVRSSNHDRGCDRRDGWVGLSPDRNDCERAFGLDWQISTRAKWRSFPSARRSVLQKSLTPPTLLEMAIFRQLMKHMQWLGYKMLSFPG